MTIMYVSRGILQEWGQFSVQAVNTPIVHHSRPSVLQLLTRIERNVNIRSLRAHFHLKAATLLRIIPTG